MELTARYGLEFNPFLKNSKESYLKERNIQKRNSVWIILQKQKASAFLPGLQDVGKQLWSVPGLLG